MDSIDSIHDDFGGTFPFQPHFFQLQNNRMHFIDEGSGDPIVFLHGNPTWSYLYRAFVSPLSAKYRIIAPDHLGFGRSSKPATAPYSLAWHIQNLSELILWLDLRNITLVLHDWGGPIGLGFAINHYARIRQLVIMNTWAFLFSTNTLPPLLAQIRQPGLGENMVLEQNILVEKGIPSGIYQHSRITPLMMDAYRTPFPTPDSRRAMLAFPREIPLGNHEPAAQIIGEIQSRLRTFKCPVAIVWGEKDPVFSPFVLQLWKLYLPHAEIHSLSQASHFLQEDEPEKILSILQSFLAAHS